MRILYHHRTMGDGAEGVHIREMIRAFRCLGHEVEVVALVGEGVEGRPGGRQWQFVRQHIPEVAYELAEIVYNTMAYRRLSKTIRRFEPDFVYDRYNTYSTGAVRAACRAAVPVFLEVNAPLAYERALYQGQPLLFPRTATRYERWVCCHASHVLAVSTPLKEFLVSERHVPAARVTVLPNAADPCHLVAGEQGRAVRARHGLEGKTVVGFVGILREWHGVDLLLRAFSWLRGHSTDLHLLIVGDGPLEAQLKAQAVALGLVECVTFCGRVRHEDVREHIAAMDIGVSARATFYASPMKILEYMTMQVPTVAPRMPNIEDILEDGEDGLLFEPEDVQSLANCLATLAGDPGLRRTLGEQARRKIADQRNWESNARVVTAIAESLGREGRRERAESAG